MSDEAFRAHAAMQQQSHSAGGLPSGSNDDRVNEFKFNTWQQKGEAIFEFIMKLGHAILTGMIVCIDGLTKSFVTLFSGGYGSILDSKGSPPSGPRI